MLEVAKQDEVLFLVSGQNVWFLTKMEK